MATIQLGRGGTYETLNDQEWYEQFSTMSQESETTTSAEYEDAGGNTISVTGKNLDSSGPGNVTGVVSDVEIRDSHGRIIFDVSDLSLSFRQLNTKALDADPYAMLEVLRFLIKGNDTITGTNGSEELMTSPDAGNDIINGRGGDDLFRAGPGNNRLNGGAGEDQLFYQLTAFWEHDFPQKSGVVLDAAKGTATNPWGGHDIISNFEKYRGTEMRDIFRGSSVDEKFALLKGNDVLDGRGGTDTVDYSFDANYGGNNGITANFASGIVIDPYGDTDHVSNVESILATKFADTLRGSNRDETFRALAGNDDINGLGGQDVFLFADNFDMDTIHGFVAKGAGHDIIQFDDVEVDDYSDLRQNHMTQSGNDVIISLGAGDVLTLKNIDIDTLSAADFLL
jgi:Ca2+-binding RTX toxin-like protein